MNEKQITPFEPLSAKEQELLVMVDNHKNELIDLVKDLIKFDTRTYNEKHFSDLHPIVKYCTAFFKKWDINTEIIECPHQGNEKQHTWPNLIVNLKGNKPGRRLGFMGHLDVVPFNQNTWKVIENPLKPEIIQGKIYGRGAIDMKSGVAAQMMAMALLKQSKVDFSGELQMIFTPDEEISGKYGAAFLSSKFPDVVAADARIIGEPTGQPPIKSPAIIIGEKGANWIRLHFHGASGHGSQPKPKSNALNKAARFINNAQKGLKFHDPKPPVTFSDLIKGILARYSISTLLGSLFSKPKPKRKEKDRNYNEDGLPLNAYFHTTVSFNQIQAGTKSNVIPDDCTLMMDIRSLPGISLQTIIDDIVHYANKLHFRVEVPSEFENKSVHNRSRQVRKRLVDISLEPLIMNTGGIESKDSEICTILASQFEKIYRTKRLFFLSPGMTDASHFRKTGIKNIVVFGPSGDNAHNADEFVYIDDLIKCTKVYLLTAYRFLNTTQDIN
ncbi:MAG: M20 family metallopeptidase [Candidatus Lokiarchaeota archaeon]|nr:M20 family metallopeptidase [Candidatus Harpocratesius repetitus]